MKLIYVNELGPNYKGDNIYEFIFSNTEKEVWGEEWDSQPANGNPSPPHMEFIEKVATLKNSEIEFNLIQKSDFFGMYDSIDGIIALAWESENSDSLTDGVKRLVFQYGENIKSVEDKFYERDIVLTYEKNLIEK
jgi:hypothetical protein